jgi:hypothetical protein
MIIFICCEESNDGDQRKIKQLYIHKLKAVDRFQDTQQQDTTRGNGLTGTAESEWCASRSDF